MAEFPVEVLSLADFSGSPEIEEDGATFAENALIKARAVAEHTGLVTVADDSGLEVDALSGAPGVLSARFAGEPKDDRRNNDKLLALLEGVDAENRGARFRCVIAIVTPGGKEYLSEGRCEGRIGFVPRGIHGFGYDPLFYLPEHGQTMAEIAPALKNRISHRARAFQEAVSVLESILFQGE